MLALEEKKDLLGFFNDAVKNKVNEN